MRELIEIISIVLFAALVIFSLVSWVRYRKRL